jgi:RNA polymerase sigma-70 factor (ECF subfamily)
MTTTVALDFYQTNCGSGSEDELLTQAQAGDTDAFCFLARAYERRIYSLALHYCRHHQDAEDLSQEVWLKAYAAISTFRKEASFYTWLRKIMINCFLNHRRARSFSWTSQESEDDASAVSLTPADKLGPSRLEINVQNRLAMEKVMEVLAEVTPQQRLSFLLKHHEGMTYEEIAKELGCSTGSVKKSVSRTVTKLRQRLGVEDEITDYSGAMGEYHVGSLGNA